jgi:hypothetical protein
VVPILRPARLVEAELVLECRELRLAQAVLLHTRGGQLQLQRVAGQQVEDREGHREGGPENDDGLGNATEDVTGHLMTSRDER